MMVTEAQGQINVAALTQGKSVGSKFQPIICSDI